MNFYIYVGAFTREWRPKKVIIPERFNIFWTTKQNKTKTVNLWKIDKKMGSVLEKVYDEEVISKLRVSLTRFIYIYLLDPNFLSLVIRMSFFLQVQGEYFHLGVLWHVSGKKACGWVRCPSSLLVSALVVKFFQLKLINMLYLGVACLEPIKNIRKCSL